MKITNSSLTGDMPASQVPREDVALMIEKVVSQQPEQHENVKISKEKLQGISEKLNNFLENQQRSIQFVLHDGLKEYYVQVINSETKEVIKEIPPKKLLDAFYAMEKFLGMIIDEKI